MKRTISTSLLILTALAPGALIAQPQYIAYDLGVPNGLCYAFGVNDAGTVVGYLNTNNGPSRAFSYCNGQLTVLGTLGGDTSVAFGVNNAGTIVGYSTLSDGNTHAFSYSHGQMTDIGTLGGSFSRADAINSAGTIVGTSSTSAGDYRAFSYSQGVMNSLGTLGGLSWAHAINSVGIIVGLSYLDGSGLPRAFRYSGGVMGDLGALDGSYSEAFGISDAGTIVGGSSSSSGYSHAFVCQNGTMTDLGTLGGNYSAAAAINNTETIAGTSDPSPLEMGHVVTFRDGRTTDLHPYLSAVGMGTPSRATAISDNGNIAGWAGGADGHWHAFLLRPFRLSISPSGSGVVLSWLTNTTVPFSLFETTNLVDGQWVAVTNAETVINDQKQVVISGPLVGSRYYRLQSQ
jgi:probable HAF family extracellular repeat protein